MKLLRAVSAVAACALCATVIAQGQIFTWSYQRHAGEAFRYRLQQTISGERPGGDEFRYETTQIVRRQVKSVSGGTVTVEERTESRKRAINGSTLPEDPARYTTITQKIASNGLLVKQSENRASAPSSLAALGAMLSQLPTPAKPGVAMDGKWETEIENQLVPGSRVTARSQLLGREKLRGIDTLRVSIKMEIPTEAHGDDSSTIRVTNFYNVDPRSGLLVHSMTTVENIELPMAKGSLKVTSRSTIDLLSVNDPNAPR